MASSIQIKRGVTAKVAAYTPLSGELVLDTTLNRLLIGDGSTVGGNALTVSRVASGIANAVTGSCRNLVMNITAASSSATVTADELIVSVALGGNGYKISGLSSTINLSTTGAGGMDTGTVPTTGFVAVYAIYNPTTATAALLAVNTTSAVAPEVYGGSNMPSGYTASALISIRRVASSQFVAGLQRDRAVGHALVNLLTATAVTSANTALTSTTYIHYNAKSIRGTTLVNVTNGTNGSISVSSDSLGSFSTQHVFSSAATSALNNVVPFSDVQVITANTIYYNATLSTGTLNQVQLNISGYTF